MKYPRTKVKIPRLPTKEDVDRLMSAAEYPYRAMIVVLYEGGLRRCRTLNLRYGDVEPWEGGCRVGSSKSGHRVA